MLFSIYLHSPIAEILMCYGDLSEVVNKILDAGEEGAFDIIDCPKCLSREGASRYDIDVANEYYISLLETFPINSTRISLRRLLYWFVENEMYDVLEWEPTFKYRNKQKEKILKKLDCIIADFSKLTLKLYKGTEMNFAKSALEHLKSLQEVIKDER